jgi:hypothetical protein
LVKKNFIGEKRRRPAQKPAASPNRPANEQEKQAIDARRFCEQLRVKSRLR